MNLRETLKETVLASKKLNDLKSEYIVNVLNDTAAALISCSEDILTANAKDLKRLDSNDPKYDRLLLTIPRINNLAEDIRNVAKLPSPLGIELSNKRHSNGMSIRKVTVPFGVIGIIYEARPNVTSDVFSLCFKSGNACVLKGGSDAYNSNLAITNIIQEVLVRHKIDPAICQLLPTDRLTTLELLKSEGLVDLIIPRGSSSLIRFVRENARVPVIETGAGICHAYFDVDGDCEIGQRVITNAKTRRVSVCNALDCLLIHHKRLKDLPFLTSELAKQNVIIYADTDAYNTLINTYPKGLLKQATEESFGTEFLDYKMSIKTVNNIKEALIHIDQYSSKHSECIISNSKTAIHQFQQQVDSACVYVNVPTSFTDGAQFGLGAEIGISTQKLHARGPMGLEELTTYKYLIEGEGQIRP